MTRRTNAQLVEDYEDTWPSHGGLVTAAAMRLGMRPESLLRGLQRARQRGVEVRYTNDTGPTWRPM